MGTIGYGYGSEWHLLRYLGYHRTEFNEAVCNVIGGGATSLNWLDSPFDPKNKFLDAEWKGLDFRAGDSRLVSAWQQFWPQTGNVPNWDAVGTIRVAGQTDLLLVEAKAHLNEIKSSCGAKEVGGLPVIRRALDQAKASFGAGPSADWLSPYYQYANRLAVLHFLSGQGVSARLLFLYFTGDSNQRANCPQVEQGWESDLSAMYTHLGLSESGALMPRVHRLFLPVCPP